MRTIVTVAAMLATSTSLAAPILESTTIWAYRHGGDRPPFAGTSEIVDYDPVTQLIFVAGGEGVTALDRNGARVRGYGRTPSSTR